MNWTKSFVVLGSLTITAAAFGQTNIDFSVDLSASGLPSINNFVGFGAQFPSTSSNAIPQIFGTISSGNEYGMANPAFIDTSYSFVGFGTVTDLSGAVHVVVLSENNIAGKSWDNYFGGVFGGLDETTIANELVAASDGGSTALTKTSEAASAVLSYYTQVDPFLSYSKGAVSGGYVTEFSNGVNIGTTQVVLNAVPEPNGAWLLAGLAPLLLMRVRKQA